MSKRFLGLPIIRQEILKCTACEAIHQNPCHSKPLPGKGMATAKLVIIAERPSINELMDDSTYSDRHGKFIRKMVEEAGLSQMDCYFTYLSKCGWRTTKRNKPAEAKNIQTCTELWLEQELAEIDPYLVMPLGMECIKYFYPKAKAMANAVELSPILIEGVWERKPFQERSRSYMVANYTPFYGMQSNSKAEKFLSQLRLASKMIKELILNLGINTTVPSTSLQ